MTKRKEFSNKLIRNRMGQTEGSLAERLDHYSMPIPECGCQIWLGGLFKNGYGVLLINNKPTGTHRASWELHNGPIPDDLYILHKCDIRCCINPNHLFLGTHLDNIADMDAKGRRRTGIGERAAKSKLTEAQVKEIRTMKGSQRQIAALFGVNHAAIGAIKRGETWKHLN